MSSEISAICNKQIFITVEMAPGHPLLFWSGQLPDLILMEIMAEYAEGGDNWAEGR